MDAVFMTKEENDHPSCYRRHILQPVSVLVWGCINALGVQRSSVFGVGTRNSKRDSLSYTHPGHPSFWLCNNMADKEDPL
ncbi:hypothetical protein GJAV_G00226480 [Gymnothorax javanicus]|nr:hypothetical protein GJAV_G00226480 [Gymnothorax javanicus]